VYEYPIYSPPSPVLKALSYRRTPLPSIKKVAENDSEKKNKTMWNRDPNCPVVVVAGILRENRKGGRPGAIVSPIVNRL
jgi:hypothetical protein